jgi:hypothetical protein
MGCSSSKSKTIIPDIIKYPEICNKLKCNVNYDHGYPNHENCTSEVIIDPHDRKKVVQNE